MAAVASGTNVRRASPPLQMSQITARDADIFVISELALPNLRLDDTLETGSVEVVVLDALLR
jgi:hypothetical protein